MPQLDISTFSSQVFWFIIFFSLLFVIVNFLFLPKLEKMIYIRNKEILDSFNSSLCLLKLVENQVIKYNSALYQAKMQVQGIMADALAQVEVMRVNIKDIIAEENKKMNQLIEKEVARFKSEHMNELKQMSVSIALIYYTKLTNSEINEKFVTNLVSKEF